MKKIQLLAIAAFMTAGPLAACDMHDMDAKSDKAPKASLTQSKKTLKASKAKTLKPVAAVAGKNAKI
jgi:hypothetical protein